MKEEINAMKSQEVNFQKSQKLLASRAGSSKQDNSPYGVYTTRHWNWNQGRRKRGGGGALGGARAPPPPLFGIEKKRREKEEKEGEKRVFIQVPRCIHV